MKKLTAINLFLVVLLVTSCTKEEKAPGGSGMIEAADVIVSAEANGRLLALYYDEADEVHTGDTLALIDTITTVLQLNQADASLNAAHVQKETAQIAVRQSKENFELAKKEYNRISALVETGAVNRQQFDQAQNAHTQAELAVQQAEASLKAAEADIERLKAQIALLEDQYKKCRPVSPINGRVVDKFADQGELLMMGKSLLKIATLDTVTVKVYLPPDDLTRIKLNDKAEIDPEDGQGKPMEGRVVWIASEAEFTPKNVQTKEARADLVYAVKIKIPNPDERLKIGMPVYVTIP